MSKVRHFAKKSSLNYEQLRTFVYSKETLDVQNKITQELRKWGVSCSQSLDNKQIEKYRKRSVINFLNSFNIVQSYKDMSSDEDVTVMLICLLALFDPSASILIAVSSIAFRKVIKFMGTRKHLHYCDAAFSGEIIGAFCLTEIGHGSNIKLLQTTATYDNINDEFVINTPTFEAAKCWSENLGILATHIILYARLITPDGEEHGLHGFIVSIRNAKTLLPHPGITISNIGEKLALNGSDHGFLVFNNYRIPHEGLLNKFADVTKEGVYSMHKDEHQQLFTSFAILVTQRISLISIYSGYSLPITLSLRYAAKSLGNQSYQYRLIPYVAMGYVGIMFAKKLREMEGRYIDYQNDSENVKSFLFGIEMLMVTSASKWLYTTLSRHYSSDCFEASQKHAYLQSTY
ncbi:hypothetical protein RI129_006490 [Pyrocoelia pectoralis]|uniref:Acyl-CoA oxidase/dehydrogenase middle domain-containing protein n=1 Tax=Pyrocoelia pectoralis TaxID=417401 RepID=A0AAN7VAT9_9COLE